MAKKLTDDYVLEMGKYRGTKLANVPASYLLFLWENSNFKFYYGTALKEYIEENLEALKQEQNKNLNNG